MEKKRNKNTGVEYITEEQLVKAGMGQAFHQVLSKKESFKWWLWGVKYHLYKKRKKIICHVCGIKTTVEHYYPCDYCGYNDH